MINFGANYRQRIRRTPNPLPINFGSRYEYFLGGKWNLYQGSGAAASTDPCRQIVVTRDRKNPGPPYRSGGPFHTVKAEFGDFIMQARGIYYSPGNVFLPGAGFNPIRLVGGFYNPDFSGFDDSANLYGSVGSLIGDPTISPAVEVYYPQVAKLRPKIAQAGLGQAIAEVRELPRMLKGLSKGFSDLWISTGGSRTSLRMAPKRAANEFLGIQFGWIPFIKDIRDVNRVTKRFDEYVEDLTIRNNRWDHMERVIEHSESVSTVNGNGWRVSPSGPIIDSLCNNVGGHTGRWQFDTLITKRAWVSGDFKFYRPEFDRSLENYGSEMNQVNQAITLYGADVNPALLYKITPWTWLVDWCSNVGDVVETISNAGADGVVSKNLYVMVQRVKQLVFTQTMNLYSGTRAVSWRRVISSKQRDHASTPFGFGLSPTELSGRQFSILTALGISRFL